MIFDERKREDFLSMQLNKGDISVEGRQQVLFQQGRTDQFQRPELLGPYRVIGNIQGSGNLLVLHPLQVTHFKYALALLRQVTDLRVEFRNDLCFCEDGVEIVWQRLPEQVGEFFFTGGLPFPLFEEIQTGILGNDI